MQLLIAQGPALIKTPLWCPRLLGRRGGPGEGNRTHKRRIRDALNGGVATPIKCTVNMRPLVIAGTEMKYSNSNTCRKFDILSGNHNVVNIQCDYHNLVNIPCDFHNVVNILCDLHNVVNIPCDFHNVVNIL